MLNFNIGLMGHVDSGKTSLSKALSEIASTAAFDKNPQSKQRGITLDLGFSSFVIDTPKHLQSEIPNIHNIQCTLVDCPGHASLIRTIIGGAQIIDLILLVISAGKGIQTQTAECLVIGEITCKHLIVVLNKIDLLEESKRASHVEKMSKKLKQVLKGTIFSNAPIVPISAKTRDDTSMGIPDLINTISDSLFNPFRNINSPFLFAIDHCFALKGKGTILTGTVLQGAVKVDDVIELPGISANKKIKSMQMFKQPVSSATCGDRLGMCVTQFDPKLIERGIACSPGLTTFINCAIISVNRIKYFKGDIRSRAKFHITIGYETAMATVICFSDPNPVNNCDFNFDTNFEYKEMLNETESDRSCREYLILEFEKPVLVVDNCKLIGSKLDMDINGNNCRIAFWGRLLSYCKSKDNKQNYLSKLNVYKYKYKNGIVERLLKEDTVIVRSLFRKETDLRSFINLKVTLSTGEIGYIECSFGQNNKVRVYFQNGLNEATLNILRCKRTYKAEKKFITVSLVFKKFIFNNRDKNLQ